ncbi:Flp pilus assembly protein TadG [Methylobacterium sp. 174MFSha1.1]|uniref:TadE/TadG family type IV pilus assembly protein n=1 Tax=Methylobacterium sp. 174MFSha1.1 TaxID=1502749 RepID=UPI0008E1F517|nr:pilus assembly protein TadG-related protein [Methylobacterium sp. 174MFSha1.1]SFV14602.1 Flp pilus assembly protein TadG [Methylobacterium sp. 174MFSha1.1]
MPLNRASQLVAALASLMRDRDGGIGIIFGLSLIPIVGLVGLGVDYGMAITNRARLDRAADASALAAVVTAKAYVAANSSQFGVFDKAKAAGATQAVNTFKVNASSVPLSSVTLPTPFVDISGQTITATVTYTATIQNSFAKLFAVPTTTVTNTMKASVDLPSYLDFYLMVDVSGSMGLPSTASGMTQLAQNNDDSFSDYKQGCQFACHFPGNKGWGLAAGKIQLRSDAVNNAVCALLQRATTPAVQNQYRIGIYPFINQLATLASLTTDVSALKAAAQCSVAWPLAFTNLLDTGATQLNSPGDPTSGIGSGGTHFEVAFPQMKGIVGLNGFGDGSTSASRKPFVFLVTDGMQNGQHFFVKPNGTYAYPGNPSKFVGYGDAGWDGSQPAQIDAKNCDALKSAGAVISILYIPYNQISFVDKGGSVVAENKKVNAFSPTLANPLQACASSGYFRTANTPADITTALNSMFDQALRVARLTQ